MTTHLLRKTTIALLLAAGTPAFAADYYIVAPVPGKQVSNGAINVSLSSLALPAGHVGLAYAGVDLRPALRVEGDPTYTGYGVKWQLVAGVLPSGLVLNSNGTVTGTPDAEGTFDFTVRAAYKTKNGDQQYQVRTYRIQVGLAGATPGQALVGEAYSYDLAPLLTVTGDVSFKPSAVTWSVVASSLPAGLYLTADGRIAGIPTAGGTGTVTARASYRNASGERTYQVVSLDIVVALGAATLPVGVTGDSYPGFDFKNVLSVSGDTGYSPGAATWSLVSGSLPAGLVLNSNGTLTGTPTAAAASSITLAATYRSKSNQRTYSLQVDPAQVTGTLSAGSDTNYGTVTVGSSAQRTFTFTTQGNTSATGVYASVTGAGMSITANTCGAAGAPISLAKGGSCQLTARYAPTAAGAMSGTVAINWAGPVADRKSLTVAGDARVDYSSLMSGFTADAIAIGRNAAWADGIQWYWRVADAQVSAPAGTFEFRRTVTVAGSAPVTATLYGSVDDSVARFSVNGTTIFTGRSMPFSTYSSSPSFTLQPGVNVLAIQVTNSGTNANPAGLALQVQGADGSVLAPEAGWRFQP
jgi:hypothetical protein